MSMAPGTWSKVIDGEHDGIGDLVRRTCHGASFLSNRDVLIQNGIIVYPSLNLHCLASQLPAALFIELLLLVSLPLRDQPSHLSETSLRHTFPDLQSCRTSPLPIKKGHVWSSSLLLIISHQSSCQNTYGVNLLSSASRHTSIPMISSYGFQKRLNPTVGIN